MSYLDDLKKKASGVVNNVNNAVKQGAQTAQNVASTVQAGVQQGAQQAQSIANNTANAIKNYAPAAQSTVQNVANGVNNAISTGKQVYDTVKSGVGQAFEVGKELYGAGQAAYNGAMQGITDYHDQDDVDWEKEYENMLQGGEATAPTPNPDGSVTVTQPNGQQVNTSQAASSTLGAGAGKWQAELDGIMNQIMNREKFSFDMNGDAMYQQYADMYQNQANLGMQNAIAQAAALTGGYGSSYGQMVGQQAYAQQMQGLNDVALDLYDRAYNQYQDEGNQLAQQYAMMAEREQQAYGREYQANRDAVADEQWEKEFGWQAEQFDKLYGEEGYYNTAREDEQAYNKEMATDEREWQDKDREDRQTHDSDMATDEREWQDKDREDRQTHDSDMATDEREWQDQDREDRQTHDSDMATDEREWQDQDREDRQTHDSDMAEQDHDWQAETWDKMYGEDGYYTKQNKQAQDNWQAEFDREGEWYDDAKEANNPNTTYEGDGTLKGESVPKQLAGVSGLTTTNTGLFDDNGYFKTAAVVSGTTATGGLNDGTPEVGKGTMTYNIGGKEVTLKTGTSPYTNSVNPDAKNGVMENGYQPDNYGGYELEEEGTTDVINGVRTPVYQIKDSNPPVKLIWDDASNQYISYGDQELPDPNDITINSNDVASPPKNPVDKPQFNGPAEPPQETLIEDEIPPEWKEEISEKLYTAEEAGTITNPTLPTGSESPEQVVEKMMGMGWKDVSNAPYSQATRDQLIAEGKMVAVDVNGKIKYLMR